jgi:hypothetical protein
MDFIFECVKIFIEGCLGGFFISTPFIIVGIILGVITFKK